MFTIKSHSKLDIATFEKIRNYVRDEDCNFDQYNDEKDFNDYVAEFYYKTIRLIFQGEEYILIHGFPDAEPFGILLNNDYSLIMKIGLMILPGEPYTELFDKSDIEVINRFYDWYMEKTSDMSRFEQNYFLIKNK